MSMASTPPFRYVSVCSGIEAATVAWHPLGWSPVLFADINPFAVAVLKHHYPEVPVIGDFTSLLENPPEADLLVGGTPCQAFSIAGRRLSMEDYRGNLSLAFADLFIRGGYRWALWENVPGVLSTKDNAFGCVLGRLVGAEVPAVSGTPGGKWPTAGVVVGPEATAAWRVLDAQYFGVAQRRRRVFVLVKRGTRNWDAPRALFSVEGCGFGGSAPSREPRQATTSDSGAGTPELPDVAVDRRTAHVSHDCVPTLKTDMGHNMGPVIVMRQREGKPGGGKGPLLSDNLSLTLAANTNDQIVFAVQNPTINKHQHGVGIGGEVMYTLEAARQHGVLEVTRVEPEQPQPVLVAEVSPTLSASGPPFSRLGNSYVEAEAVVVERGLIKPGSYALRARRLTPVEAERLQGFPDNYTLIECARTKSGKKRYRRITPADAIYLRRHGAEIVERNGNFFTSAVGDTLRYTALGNSMAVPVMQWIGRQIGRIEHNTNS